MQDPTRGIRAKWPSCHSSTQAEARQLEMQKLEDRVAQLTQELTESKSIISSLKGEVEMAQQVNKETMAKAASDAEEHTEQVGRAAKRGRMDHAS